MGIDGRLEAAVQGALGNPQRVREIALIPRQLWDTTMAALQVEEPGAADGDPPVHRDLSPVEVAKLESLRRVCNLRVGQPADDRGTGLPVAPAAPGPLLPPAGGGPAGQAGPRRIKLSAVLDPTLDADIVPLTEGEVTRMYDAYRSKFGDFPTDDADVSRDQLAAVRQVVQANACPYADFSVWGPFGQRLLRKQTYLAYHLNPTTGDWIRKEQPGPDSFHSWYEAWKCYRTALLLTEACEAERLDAYSEMIRSFVQQYGEEMWSFVSRADSRMRSEQLDRIRRRLRADPMYGYQEGTPWSACFAAAVRESEFWQRELATPLLMFVARNKREPASESKPDDRPTNEGVPKRQKVRANRRYTGEDRSKKNQEGLYSLNRKGIEICHLYNQGKCGSEKAQGKCRNQRSHQCNKCLGPHQGLKCGKEN